MPGWQAARLAGIESGGDEYPSTWHPIRHHFGIRAFGVNAWVATEAQQEVVERHDEVTADGSAGHEELYAVTTGHAVFTVDGEEVEAPAGTLLFVGDPSVVRHAIAREPGTTVFCIGGWPDRAFEPSAWELRALE